MTKEEKIMFYAAANLRCADCPYKRECHNKATYTECMIFLRDKLTKAIRRSTISDLYTELDGLLENRQIKESEELRNGIILARLELLDYVRKKTENE